MASSTSAVLKLELMATGENDGTWGTKHNTNMVMLESGLAGVVALSLGASDVTLTDVDFVDDQAKKRVIDCTGTLTANVDIIVPNRARLYYLINRTTGSFTLGLKTAAGTAKNVTQPAAADMFCDGSDNILFLGCETVTGTGAPAISGGAAASSVSVAPSGNLASTDAQAAFLEHQGDIDTINADVAGKQPLDTDLTAIAAFAKTKGNMITANGSAWTALAAGTNGFALVADSAQASGVKYESLIPAGTKSTFNQTAAPVGWTKDATHNDKALRVVSGSVVNGGTVAFETAFASQSVTGTSDGTTLTIAQLALHGHVHRVSPGNGVASNTEGGVMLDSFADANYAAFTGTPTETPGQQIGGTGGDTSHNHSFTGNAINLDVQFVDVIIATKDAI